MPQSRWLLLMQAEVDEETATPGFALWLMSLDRGAEPVRVHNLDELLAVLTDDWYRLCAAAPAGDPERPHEPASLP